MESETKRAGTNWWLVSAGTLALLALCMCVGLAGFALGRSDFLGAENTAVPQLQTEIVEVTREVTVIPPTTDIAGQAVAEDEAVQVVPTLPSLNTPDTPPASQTDPQAAYTDISNLDMELLYEVWDVVEEEFDGQLPPSEDLLYALIGGSLETLDDDYTRFIEPELAARLREDMGGTVSGIGAFVRENDDGFIEIVAPIEDQPADLAGLLPGDLIVGVDGDSVIGQSFDEVLLLVRGPEGTSVTLTIQRPGETETREFTIVRTRFEVPVTEAEMLPGNIAYLQLTEFNQVSAERMAADLQELLAQNPTGLILDLRNNPGGYLDQSIAIADFFLPASVVLYERNNQGLDEVFRAADGGPAESIALVVLVNQASASASEIVAGALRDNGRAILIGVTTFGKGSVQQVHTLSNGAELRVTIARWYTPANVSISDNGLAPDIEVEAPADMEIGGEDDVQLQRAIEYIQTGQ